MIKISKKWERPKAVSDSFFGAKLFYCLTKGLVLAVMLVYDRNIFMFSIKDCNLLFPITFLVFVITSIYLFLTTGNNPGFYNTGTSIGSNEDCVVITLNNEITQSHEIFINPDDKKEENNFEMQKTNNKEAESTIEKVPKEIMNNNEEDPFKFCEICKIEKFLRMKHCDKCEKCVHKFDHPCFWVGRFSNTIESIYFL